MFCNNCGKEIAPGASACTFCGAPAAAEPAPQYADPQQPQYAAPQQPQYAAPQQPQYAAPQQPQYAAPQQTPYAVPQPQYAQPLPQYAQPVQAAPAAVVTPEQSSLSTKILVFGIISIASGTLIALIFGIIAGNFSRQYLNQYGALTGRAKVGSILGKVGMILGIVSTVIIAIYIILIIIAAIAAAGSGGYSGSYYY